MLGGGICLPGSEQLIATSARLWNRAADSVKERGRSILRATPVLGKLDCVLETFISV